MRHPGCPVLFCAAVQAGSRARTRHLRGQPRVILRRIGAATVAVQARAEPGAPAWNSDKRQGGPLPFPPGMAVTGASGPDPGSPPGRDCGRVRGRRNRAPPHAGPWRGSGVGQSAPLRGCGWAWPTCGRGRDGPAAARGQARAGRRARARISSALPPPRARAGGLSGAERGCGCAGAALRAGGTPGRLPNAHETVAPAPRARGRDLTQPCPVSAGGPRPARTRAGPGRAAPAPPRAPPPRAHTGGTSALPACWHSRSSASCAS